MSLPPQSDISSFASTGGGTRQDECLSEDGQVRDGSEIKRAGLQWCRAWEQLSLLGAEAGDLWSLFSGSPKQGFSIIQVVFFSSTGEMGTAELGGSRLNREKVPSSVQEPSPRLLWAHHSAESPGHKATRWVLLHLLLCTTPSSCESHSSPVRVFSAACYQKGRTKAEALTLALCK